MEVRNKKWTEDQFFRVRKDVLARWPTGKEIDLDEAIEYRKALPDNKTLVPVLAKAKTQGKTLMSVFVGHATVEDSLEHLRTLQDNGSNLLHLLPDTYTRRGRYVEAESALQACVTQGKSLLNGYPFVNHGLQKARYIRENIDLPVIVPNSDGEYGELLTEMSLAAGFERTSGDVEAALRTGLRSYSLEQKMFETQYKNRLVAYYTEKGAPVATTFQNCFAAVDPPEIKVAVATMHSLLAAEQGVKYIHQGLALGCHLIQDVAAFRSVSRLTEEYLKRFGYEVDVSLWAYPFGGVWPREQNRAAATGALNVIISVLAGVDWFPIKSFHEAIGVPTKEANAMALQGAKHLVNIIGKQRLDESVELKTEIEMITLGARAIIEKALELGDGDAAVGQIKAVEFGMIDVAFSPFKKAKGKAFPTRDAAGAIRYLDPGNIPLPPEVSDYHRQKIAERERADPHKKRYQQMIEDVHYIAQEIED